jgi:hypothetical protein
MVTRAKKKAGIESSVSLLAGKDSAVLSINNFPLFDIKSLEHESLRGFIKHPKTFFLKSRYMSLFSKEQPENSSSKQYMAFSFSSKVYRTPGTIIEVTLRTVNETHGILGKVVASIQSNAGYEVGMLLMNARDYTKLRYIEQICYIDDKLIESLL